MVRTLLICIFPQLHGEFSSLIRWSWSRKSTFWSSKVHCRVHRNWSSNQFCPIHISTISVKSIFPVLPQRFYDLSVM